MINSIVDNLQSYKVLIAIAVTTSIEAEELKPAPLGILPLYRRSNPQGRWEDNVFVERLWRSVKYEEVYLRAYDSVAEARESLDEYFEFYNTERRHQSLKKQTPESLYNQSAARMAA